MTFRNGLGFFYMYVIIQMIHKDIFVQSGVISLWLNELPIHHSPL